MLRSFAASAVMAALSLASASCRGTKEDNRLLPTAPSSASTPILDPAAPPRRTGHEVVALVAARYPERLVGGVSLEQRVANMAFLRDRIIETGRCEGLLLAWNRKTNGHRSIDAINWRHGLEDRNDVVDLAADYDNPATPLRLQWVIVGGPAGWDAYPEHGCSPS